VKDVLLSIMYLMLLIDCVAGAEREQITGDWTIAGVETICDKHIRLNGTLILPSDARLTLKNCTLEIVAEFSRQ
jgi:hypothetical protein